ncbi:WD40-repeat-containing domain protein [Cladochytrium replicatum]|nr:WD40-repeat-containing domain protein [Cladochytrium replicatum]
MPDRKTRTSRMGTSNGAGQSSSAVYDPNSPFRSKNALVGLSSGHGSSSKVKTSHNIIDRHARGTGQTASGITVAGAINTTIQVLDDEGNDVTPQPLMAPQKSVYILPFQKNPGHVPGSTTEVSMMSTAKDTVNDALNNLESMAMGSWNASAFGRSGVNFSGSSRASGASTPDGRDDENSSIHSQESGDEKEDAEVGRATKQSQRQRSANQLSSKYLTETELNSLVDILLAETPTIVLYDLPSTSVSNDYSEEVALVKSMNSRYKELKATKANNDNYTDHGMQTINNTSKNKEVQASTAKTVNAECMVTGWSIYDTFQSLDKSSYDRDSESDPRGDQDGDALQGSGDGRNTGDMGTATYYEDAGGDNRFGAVLNAENLSTDVGSSARIGGAIAVAAETSGALAPSSGIDLLTTLNQENLRNSLSIMERAVVANNYRKKLTSYRGVRDIEDIYGIGDGPDVFDEEVRPLSADEADLDNVDVEASDVPTDDLGTSIPTLELLWSFRCELTRARSVTYIAWNKENEDLIAVSYGESKLGGTGPAGLLLCWSVKNLEWPERIYKTGSGATALDFSKSNPNLLASGFSDGRISIYDVRKNEDKSALENSEISGKHRDPVWELKWIERERVMGDEHSRGETLVSISTDGRVTQWMIRKGLESTELMTLKRVSKSDDTKMPKGSTGGNKSVSAVGRSTAFISRHAGGLCFDFNTKDSNIYLVGTEDGHIHRCSCSYNEQYLSSYFGHTGPVYKVKWSPYLPSVFLSCSADWTVRLWDQDHEECVFKFQSGRDSVTDIGWCPWSSTVFGCVASDGRMEIWDLQFSVLDPVLSHTVLDRSLTSITFASRTPVVLTGDDTGAISVYKLKRANGGELFDIHRSDNAITPEKSGLLALTSLTGFSDHQSRILLSIVSGKNHPPGENTASAGNLNSGLGKE